MQSDCSHQSLNNFIKSLGFCEFSQELVNIAFTHSSYTKENNLPYTKCYERLEFLGDAVLKMATTDYLYKTYPEKQEGELTKIRSVVVSDEILHKVAINLGIEPFIKVSEAEKKCGGQKLESIQACVIEAMFGALYLSSDKQKLNEFIINNLKTWIEDVEQNRSIYNAKAILQEYTQAESKEIPIYETIAEIGAAHDKTFCVSVVYKNKSLATATGKSKKQAQQLAAYEACKKLNLIKEENENK